MNLFKRSIVALLAVLVFAGASFWLQSGYSFTVAKPTQQLSGFPTSFDGWVGQEEEITEGVAKILVASDVLSLRFVRGSEVPVFLHVSTWTEPDSVAETCPHHPDICYRGNGWSPKNRAVIPVHVDGVGDIPVQAVEMQRGDQHVIVAFTYRMGNAFFADEVSARRVQLDLFGIKVWPAVTKFMIQTNHQSIDAAKPTIEVFAKQFFSWQVVESQRP